LNLPLKLLCVPFLAEGICVKQTLLQNRGCPAARFMLLLRWLYPSKMRPIETARSMQGLQPTTTNSYLNEMLKINECINPAHIFVNNLSSRNQSFLYELTEVIHCATRENENWY